MRLGHHGGGVNLNPIVPIDEPIYTHDGSVAYDDPIFAGDPTTAVDRLRSALEKGFKKLPNVSQ